MRILIATDKFKGSLTASEVAEAVRAGLLRARPGLHVDCLPVADGGEGTLDLARAAGHELVPVAAAGPTGLPVHSRYARSDDTAVVELADVCGMKRLPNGLLQPMEATSGGVGDVIVAAVEAGCRRVIVGIGGSASTDGGVGMLHALGARFLDETCEPLERDCLRLDKVHEVDLGPAMHLLSGVELIFGTDVDNVLVGVRGAAFVYGPQKGATPEQTLHLDQALRRWADIAESTVGRRFRDESGAGAAGGVGFGAMLLGAQIAPGSELFLQMAGLEAYLAEADVVIVGEGSLDEQSLRGKAPVGVARAARGRGTRVVAICGQNLLSDTQLRQVGIERAFALADLEPDLARSMEHAPQLLHEVGQHLARVLGRPDVSPSQPSQ